MPKNVIVYSTPTCPYCQHAKQFLKEQSVSYIECDVSRDKAKAEEMVKKSGQMGVPVIDIDGQILIGFNKTEIEKILHKK